MFSKNLNISYQSKISKRTFFFMIFFCLTNSKRDNLEVIIAFLQKYNIQFKKFESRKENQIIQFVGYNVNYAAYCFEPISPTQFKEISQYLSSKVLIVAFFHTNEIYDLLRINATFENNKPNCTQKDLTTVIV